MLSAGGKGAVEAQVIGMNTHGIFVVHRRLKLAAVAMVAFALAPATALAQSPTEAQYGSTLQQFSQGGGGSGTDPGSAAGGLPFTGLDVVALAVVAVGLLVAGLMLRRHRPTTPSEG